DLWGVLDGSVAGAPWLVPDDHRRLAHVVRVIALGQLVAESRRRVLDARAVASAVGCVRRVHGDAYGVDPWRDHRLSVTAIEHEVLSSKLPDVGIGPPIADALEAVALRRATAPIAPPTVTAVDVVRIGVEHAEAALGGLPGLAVRVNELVRGVMLKVEVIVACGELKEPVLVREVAVALGVQGLQRASDDNT